MPIVNNVDMFVEKLVLFTCLGPGGCKVQRTSQPQPNGLTHATRAALQA